MNHSVSGYQGNWIYPVLSPDEILQCMTELGIPLTLDDLQKPSASKMQVVYTAFADIIMGVTKDYFDASIASCEAAQDSPDHFDIYADSLLLVIFYQHLHVLMKEVGFPEFALSDITRPDPKRIRRILSAIINFAKFREERLEVYDRFTHKAGEYAQRLDDLTAMRQELEERLERAKERRLEEEPLVGAAKEKNEGLTNELYELKRIEAGTMAEYDKLKSDKAELTERLHANQVLRQNTEREVAKVKSRIVHSPEKLRSALTDLAGSLQNERQAVADKSRKRRELVAKQDLLESLEADVQTCVKLMEECEQELSRVDTAQRRVAQFEEQLHDKSLEVRELNKREEQLKRKLANAHDKLDRASRQLEAKRAAARDRMAGIAQERKAVLEDRARADNDMDAKKALIEEFNAKMAELRHDAQLEQEGVNAEFAKLRAHVTQYMKEVSQAMEQTAQAL
ncbi:SUMO conjugating enzyme Hus5 [Savitreella phatthalungensis]